MRHHPSHNSGRNSLRQGREGFRRKSGGVWQNNLRSQRNKWQELLGCFLLAFRRDGFVTHMFHHGVGMLDAKRIRGGFHLEGKFVCDFSLSLDDGPSCPNTSQGLAGGGQGDAS
jgi:hypothetical protein